MNALVDWELAERTAGAMITGVPGWRGERAQAGYTAPEVERACGAAIDAVSEYCELGAVSRPPRPQLVDRRQWAANALVTIADAAAPLEERLARDLRLPGPLGGAARRAVGAAIGVEAGVAAGYAAKRVLGQYDVAVFGQPRAARLLFVAENLDAARLALAAPPEPFLRWVSLHEATHVVQFERVAWLAPHVRALAAGLLDQATAGLDAPSLAATGRRLLTDPAGAARALLRGDLARLLTDPRQRALLDRLQATMTVVEGHAEHVMDACFGDSETLAELRRSLAERRARRGALGVLVGRLLGIELKLRQYEVGKRFCDALEAHAGPDGLRALWSAPETLPDLDELEAPRAWLSRVAPVTA